MLEDHLAEPVVPEARHERHRNTQPRQTERDVSRTTAWMGDERPTSALADQVDKRLPHDNKHAHHHPDQAQPRRHNSSSASWRGESLSWPCVSYSRWLARPRVSK